MEILETVGIDISKLSFDVRIHSTQAYEQFNNTNQGFSKLLKWVYKNTSYSKNNILFALEHTGLYSHKISVFLAEKKIPFALIPGLEIKRSLGLARGKNDKADSTNIAKYAYRLRDEIKQYKMPVKQVQALKHLLSLRERLVKQRSGFKVSLKEQKDILIKKENIILFRSQEQMIKQLSNQILIIEKEMMEVIKSDDELIEQFKLIISINGVGMQTALYIITYTSGFTKFNSWRKFASYCGIAPFTNLSGTSIRGRTKVSHLANKKLKSLLDLCAKSSIQNNPEMIKYYNKRVEEGKNKMSTINIIRNKLLSRIFAVVNRKTPYVDILKYAT